MPLQVGDSLPQIRFQTADGPQLELREFPARPLLLVFIRHLACLLCREHLMELASVYPQIRDAGGDVLVVSFSPPARLPDYLAAHPWPFTVVSDPQRRAYQALGLSRGSWWRILGPKTLVRYLLLMLRGRKPEMPAQADDVRQLGGDFVIDARHRIVYAHPSHYPADRPAVSELLDAVRRAAPASRATV